MKVVFFVAVCIWANAALAENRSGCLADTMDGLRIALCACYNVVLETDRLVCYDTVLLKSYQARAIELARARRAASEAFGIEKELLDAVRN